MCLRANGCVFLHNSIWLFTYESNPYKSNCIYSRATLANTPCTYMCAYVPTQPHRQVQILKACLSDGTVGHLGRIKTIYKCSSGTIGLGFSTTSNNLWASLVPHNHRFVHLLMLLMFLFSLSLSLSLSLSRCLLHFLLQTGKQEMGASQHAPVGTGGGLRPLDQVTCFKVRTVTYLSCVATATL